MAFDVFLVVRSPTLNTALKVWSQQSWVQGDRHAPGLDPGEDFLGRVLCWPVPG